MIDLDELQTKLKAMAETINLFKSEAVQLRVIEVLLGHLGAVPEKPITAPKAGSKSRRRRAKPASSTETKASPARRSSRTSASSGALISDLLSSGFFKTPQTISKIVEHCARTRGHHFKASQCSPVLLRLVRDRKLERHKNKDGQYEYKQA